MDTDPRILHPQEKREIKPKMKFIGAHSDETGRYCGRIGKGKGFGENEERPVENAAVLTIRVSNNMAQ